MITNVAQVFGKPYQELINILKEVGIKYYLIGAGAKLLHLATVDQKPISATKDIDLAVLIESKEEFTALSDKLLNSGFIKDRGHNAFWKHCT